MPHRWSLGLAVALTALTSRSCSRLNDSASGGWVPAGVTGMVILTEQEAQVQIKGISISKEHISISTSNETGGACGYGDAVTNPPFNAMVSAGGPSLFRDGHGCGACFQLVCEEGACSGRPVTVVITDECPGGPCASEPVHFDLSGRAIGTLAKPGFSDQLRAAGVLSVLHRRVPCSYESTTIAFRMEPGANPYYVAFVVEYENGNEDLASVELRPAGGDWMAMGEMRSAVWKLNSGSPLQGPFDIKLTSAVTNKAVVAWKVIPANWSAGYTYRSVVNF